MLPHLAPLPALLLLAAPAALPPLQAEPDASSFREPVDVLLVLEGEAAGDEFGWIARDAGDADGDGTTDLLVSAPWKALAGPRCGRIYVFFGRTGELLLERSGEPGFQLSVGLSEAGRRERRRARGRARRRRGRARHGVRPRVLGRGRRDAA